MIDEGPAPDTIPPGLPPLRVALRSPAAQRWASGGTRMKPLAATLSATPAAQSKPRRPRRTHCEGPIVKDQLLVRSLPILRGDPGRVVQ